MSEFKKGDKVRFIGYDDGEIAQYPVDDPDYPSLGTEVVVQALEEGPDGYRCSSLDGVTTFFFWGSEIEAVEEAE